LQNIANDFLKTLIEQFRSKNVFNSDQSFQLEIHSGRSNEGVKKVECVVQLCQYIISSTYSYTIQPIISCNGNLLSPLFIVLKEINNIFGYQKYKKPYLWMKWRYWTANLHIIRDIRNDSYKKIKTRPK